MNNRQSGFTLIELMVSMAILGILAALSTPNIMNEINQKRATVAVEETQLIIDAARSYRMATGKWPGDDTCSNALSVLGTSTPPYITGIGANNKYNSPYSTSCTSLSFSVDQNAVADWDGYLANSLASTQIVDTANHLIRTTVGIPGSEPALDAKLSRVATGNAELNRMRTTLLMGGNDIKEINGLDAVSATLSGTLAVQGVSQFNDELVLNKIVKEGDKGCTTGAIARDVDGKTLSCQSGVWQTSGGGGIGRYQCSSQLGSFINQFCVDTDGGNVLYANNNGPFTTFAMSNWPLGWNSTNTICSTSMDADGATIYVSCANTTTAKRCYRNIYQSGGGPWNCSV